MTIKPKIDTILKASPINLKPIFKNNGPTAQNNNIKPTIMQLFHRFLSLLHLSLT